MTLAEAAPLVRFRAEAMQQAVPVGAGAMAAILGMNAIKVIAGCAEAMSVMGKNTAETVEAANFNDPMQTVIAGSKAAVDKACEVLKANGAKRALLLPVSAPFHSSLMKPAAEKLKEKLVEMHFQHPRFRLSTTLMCWLRLIRSVFAPRFTDRLLDRFAGWSVFRPSRRGVSTPSPNVVRVKYWPVWSKELIPI